MYVVIMAGGGGTRLRPLSRPDRPKPFLPLVGEETLLQRTVSRLLDGDELPLGQDDIWVVTDQRYGQLVREQVPDVGMVVEPTGKNTAAAIALATVRIDRPEDEVMLVLPADHWIEQEAAFRAVLASAAGYLATGAFGIEDPLVTLGTQVRYASTDFGYLRPDTFNKKTIHGLVAYPLLAFEEKPSEQRARDLRGMPGVAWNAGMFLWRRRAIQAALEKYTPLMTLIGTSFTSDLALRAAYERILAVSIDKAVMEGAAADHRVIMGSMNVGWSDLGSWSALLGAIAPGHKGVSGRVVQNGERIETTADDLVVRSVAGHLVVEEPPERSVVADAVWAHLAGARQVGDEVRKLVERVERQEHAA